MALTALEHLALWGPPVLMLLLTAAYYLKWGKEAENYAGDGTSYGGGG